MYIPNDACMTYIFPCLPFLNRSIPPEFLIHSTPAYSPQTYSFSRFVGNDELSLFASNLIANRFAGWCIRNEREIFMNDVDMEYSKYLQHKPVPVTGIDPKAALYVPLTLHHKIAGFITVRTIRKHVYQQHHVYLLKTVGNFV